ncbi:MAG: ATP-binding cassette domain-containing protein [Candidatus Rokuibacteriota bacterium]|nr:MAG: ATP-binding cassette domain-containing protein [Candidatus Rokubacteria bacterium]
MTGGAIIYLEDVTVDYDGFKALSHLNFFMDRRELRVVIGPNGAGKTTLLDVISGRVRPAAGRVIFGHATDVTRLRENDIVALGIGRKFQTPSVFVNLSVWDNVELSLKRHSKGVFAGLWESADAADERRRIAETLERVGLAAKAGRQAGVLSGMTDEETARTGELLMAIAADRSVLVIEHDMEFVRQIARTVTVLHQGTVLCEGPVAQIQNDPRVLEVYLGQRKETHAVR